LTRFPFDYLYPANAINALARSTLLRLCKTVSRHCFSYTNSNNLLPMLKEAWYRFVVRTINGLFDWHTIFCPFTVGAEVASAQGC